MKFSQALRNLILIQTTMMLVHGEKGSMDSYPTAVDDNRELKKKNGSSKDDRYPYSRNYVAVIEPDNFVTLLGSGDLLDLATSDFPDLQGSSIVEFGNVYDPADLAIVNKLDGVESDDPGVSDISMMDMPNIIGKRYAGDRQPKFPIPPGDKAYFFHGECVATSVSALDSGNFFAPANGVRPADLLTQTSHTCNLNLCLGGGGFDCIAIYAGTAFVFAFGKQISVIDGGPNNFNGSVSLPPPFPATIIGGTGSFEGIEGTVDIATICGTTGPNIVDPIPNRSRKLTGGQVGVVKIGYIVQTIKVKSNMLLPVAP